MDSKDKNTAAIAAAVLKRGKMLHHVSLVLFAITLALFVFKGASACIWAGLMLALGLAELWFAVRVALDADLFSAIAEGRLDTAALDDALTRLGMIRKQKARRSMEDRSRGAFRLLLMQAVCLLAQVMAFVAMAVCKF